MCLNCGSPCLGPLAFHPNAVGDQIQLSLDNRLANRISQFKNGLLFSDRKVRVLERVRLRVESADTKWEGALRVGFTNVPPESRSLPLPQFAIPELTETSGHWAGPLPEEFCLPGRVVEFWVTRKGSLYVTTQRGHRWKLVSGVCVAKPLWAMIDVYGQTTAVLLLGSKISGRFFTRRSCQPRPFLVVDTDSSASDSDDGLDPPLITDGEEVMTCVACMTREAAVSQPCGHRCLCAGCYWQVFRRSATCPLCRERMTVQEVP
ncbi:E3 ubiquitin-protein ligase NEURL3 [Syngnathoides biaculeatus]|uniref:E3 ubiquitin-protein ligase NEURL3 n=1 Tax=Syngnathoides biaculeatus TaxID=300417 RepID=UPI002ADD36CA|nr:E3 ubiquitin-protein ligase NEURL3 [Syngnathoides biaculeatus]